jgi:hypothetical protein
MVLEGEVALEQAVDAASEPPAAARKAKNPRKPSHP